ncbi:MAG: hypothetical protein LBU34_14865 [Planctomycetaceae bacterium]|jgi:hypothetical protein|nr:hypothetical protein [Planctomycetaceae bacterium]
MIIRWSRIIPRLVILVLVIVIIWLGRNELIRWQLRSNLQRQTGAAAEIGSVRTDLQKGGVMIGNVRFFDPKSPSRELFRAEKISVQGSYDDLLYRYFRLSELNVEGVRIVIDGTDGQELIPNRLWNKLNDQIPKELKPLGELDWLALLSEKPEDAAKNLLKQLETSQLLADLKQRWQNEIVQFETAANLLKQRFQNTQGLTESAQKNAQKTDNQLQWINELLKELEATDSDIRKLLEHVTKLKSSAQGDYQSLVGAVQRDRDKIKSKSLQVPKIDAESLSESLIGTEIKEQWEKTVTWGNWARSLLVPVEAENQTVSIYDHFGLTPPKRFRGEKIHLTALDARPELLIETTNLTGQVLFGTLPVYFNGIVKNLAQPITLGFSPTVAQFCFSGSGIPASPVLPENNVVMAEQLPAVVNPDIVPNIYITLQIDRIGENNEDQMILCCPMYQLSERILGRPDKLTITVSPGISRLDGVLLLQGEKLSGEIRITQSGVRFSAMMPEKSQNKELQSILQQLLEPLDNFTASVLVSGTRSEPVYVFKSNIADVIRPRIELLVQEKWDKLCREAERLVIEEANQGTATLNTVLQEKLDPVMNGIDTSRSQWEQQITQLSGVPFDRLVQSQISKLSPKDQQRLNNFLKSPVIQSLLQNRQPEQNPQQIDPLIQHGIDKLQDKIPGLLEQLRKKDKQNTK